MQNVSQVRARFSGPSPTQISQNELERQRHSRSSSAELTEPLVFVPQRQRNAVSRREDETDNWGNDELDIKEEHKLLLRDNSLRNTVLSRLHTFRKNRELCDVILFVKEREIIGHKVVLAAISNSLFELFKNEVESVEESAPPSNKSESSRNSVGPNNSMSYFEFNQGDYDCFEALVDFAYTGVLSISNLKIADLYKTSFALQIDGVSNACARHLAENLSIINCIQVRRHANFNNDVYLVDKVDSYIVENFEQVISDSVEFTKLPCVKTRIIVPHNGSQINEEVATIMATRAIAYFQSYPKISERVEQQIEALTQKSHLLYVENDKDTLEDCSKINEETILGASEMIQDYKRSKESKSSKTAGHNSQPLGVQPIQHHVTGALPVKIDASRVSNAKYASNESLDSIGSSQTDVEQEITSKLISLNQSSPGFWIALSVLYKRLVVLSIQLTDDEDITGSAESTATTPPHETLNGNGHLTNGANVKQTTDLSQASVLAKIANCSALTKETIPPMSTARCSVGAAFLNGKSIIVCGGYNRGDCMKSVEEYDLSTGKWKPLTPMKTERGRLGSATVNGKLYAVGGSDGNNDLQTVECFDPKTQTWSSVPPLIKARSNNACAELNGQLYCIGGSNEQGALRECERFNTEINAWEPIAPLQTSRSQAACTTFRGQIVVVGGSNRSGCLDSVEAYDPQSNTWKYLSKLGTPRRGCGVASCKNFLYVIGGNDGTQPLQTTEALEHPNSHWRAAPSLNVARANTNCVVTAGNSIYLIGGFDNIQFLSSIEVMESETLGWRNYVSQHKTFNEDEEEVGSLKSEEETKSVEPRSQSVTPRASAAQIAVQ